ncbi:MAG: hypothetical protein HWE39_12440 [Oceanospirillaceae bacterium]|nr:hypothetical protein [Oceanospirillaceae bacterium]
MKLYEIDITQEENFSLLIIPDIGCSGCIYQAKQFLADHIDTPKIRFVVTSITSKKDIEFKFEQLKDRVDKVLFDYNNRFIDQKIVEFYPRIIQFSFGKEVFNEEILPGKEDTLNTFEELFLSKN